MKRNPVIAILFLFTLIITSCTKNIEDAKIPVDPAEEVLNDNDNMLMGNPSKAATLIDSPENYLIRNPYYALSYNKFKGTAKWVSWHLYRNDLGSISRQEEFKADTVIPNAWYHIQNYSYSGSGFNRGHNCPSADRTSSIEANYFTFFMTNIIPQAPKHNQVTWSNMETYIRDQVYAGKEAYIIMGSYGLGGTGNNGYAEFLDFDHLTVPSHIWKVVVLIDNDNGDLNRVSASTRVIAVDIPNNNNVNSDWKTYRTSVDFIEAAAKINLLSRVPEAVQADLESKVDEL